MSENQSQSYEHLTADEVTIMLGKCLAAEIVILTDRNRGILSTAFAIAKHAKTSDLAELIDATLAKNGIEEIQSDGNACINYFPEIIHVVKSRGSNAAAEIERYHRLTTLWRQKRQDTLAGLPAITGPLAGLRTKIRDIRVGVQISHDFPNP